MLSDAVRQLLREVFAKVYLTGGIGSSEIGMAAKETRAFAPVPGPCFELDPTVAVLGDDLRPVRAGGVGRLARSGAIPLGYDQDPSGQDGRELRHRSGGRRLVLPGDFARIGEDGTITLLGRGSACINSGGEKIFPDEVEAVITSQPAVRGSCVIGVADTRWMQRVTTLIEVQIVAAAPSPEEIPRHCRAQFAG